MGQPYLKYHSDDATSMIKIRMETSFDQIIPNAFLTHKTWQTTIFDDWNLHDPVSNSDRITINTAGYYCIISGIRWNNSTLGYRTVSIMKNDTNLLAQQSMDNVPTKECIVVSTLAKLEVDDWINIELYHTHGTNLTTKTGARTNISLFQVE